MAEPQKNELAKREKRDKKGQYGKGNTAAAALHRKKIGESRSKTAMIKKALLSMATPFRMQNILLHQINQAEKGDLAAAKFVFETVLGKNAQPLIQVENLYAQSLVKISSAIEILRTTQEQIDEALVIDAEEEENEDE